jgi:hypothetical protein
MKNLMQQRLCSSCVAGINTARKILAGHEIEDETDEPFEQLIDGDSAEQEALERLIAALERTQVEDPKLKAVRYTEHGHKLRILKIRDNIVKIEKVVKRLRND